MTGQRSNQLKAAQLEQVGQGLTDFAPQRLAQP